MKSHGNPLVKMFKNPVSNDVKTVHLCAGDRDQPELHRALRQWTEEAPGPSGGQQHERRLPELSE